MKPVIGRSSAGHRRRNRVNQISAAPAASVAVPVSAHCSDGPSSVSHAPTQAMGSITTSPVPCSSHNPPRRRAMAPRMAPIHFMMGLNLVRGSRVAAQIGSAEVSRAG